MKEIKLIKLQRLRPPKVPLTYEHEVKVIKVSNDNSKSWFINSHSELLEKIANYTSIPVNYFINNQSQILYAWKNKKIVMFWMNKLIEIHQKVEKNKSSSKLKFNHFIALENLLLLITLKVNQRSIVAPINNTFRTILSIFLPIIFIVIRNFTIQKNLSISA